jgi:hypothetical protein
MGNKAFLFDHVLAALRRQREYFEVGGRGQEELGNFPEYFCLVDANERHPETF